MEFSVVSGGARKGKKTAVKKIPITLTVKVAKGGATTAVGGKRKPKRKAAKKKTTKRR